MLDFGVPMLFVKKKRTFFFLAAISILRKQFIYWVSGVVGLCEMNTCPRIFMRHVLRSWQVFPNLKKDGIRCCGPQPRETFVTLFFLVIVDRSCSICWSVTSCEKVSSTQFTNRSRMFKEFVQWHIEVDNHCLVTVVLTRDGRPGCQGPLLSSSPQQFLIPGMNPQFILRASIDRHYRLSLESQMSHESLSTLPTAGILQGF